MTEHWRGDPDEESGMSRWYRGRWKYGSIYVLDIDRLICDPQGTHGILIEEKHALAIEGSARITRMLAQGLGWWSARFVYTTDDASPWGEPTRIDATFWNPDGEEHEVLNLNREHFERWVCSKFGAEKAA